MLAASMPGPAPRLNQRSCNWEVEGKGNHPVNCVDYHQATQFCAWIGGRLPSSEEWEYAAEGGESHIFPWGNNHPDPSRACYSDGCGSGTAPVESYAAGATRHGLLNMAGNVWEWTANNSNATNKQVRGGGWGDGIRGLRISVRSWFEPGEKVRYVGFRCALQ